MCAEVKETKNSIRRKNKYDVSIRGIYTRRLTHYLTQEQDSNDNEIENIWQNIQPIFENS